MPNKLSTSVFKSIFLIIIVFFLTPHSIQAAHISTTYPTSFSSGQTLTAKNLSLTFILLTQHNSAQLSEIRTTIQTNGGQVTHTFPQQALIVKIPDDLQQNLATMPEIAIVSTDPVDLAATDIYGPDARQYAGIWNNLINPASVPEEITLQTADHADETHEDALIAPDLPTDDQLGIATDGSVTPGYYQTSDYMAGSVAVGIVLLESNGQIDPSSENWTADEKQRVVSEIVSAFNWWATIEPRANLSFVYDDHFTQPLPTGVEPITRPYYHQGYWINEAMSRLGHNNASYFGQVRDYNNNLRQTYQTDWAFTIFIVDSSADGDNRFSDGFFAYAYLGGPFMVLTSGVNGYGSGNMDAVAAHEIGHIFHALDQYYTAYQSCTRRSGYLNVENQNSQYGGCQSNLNSIMRGQLYPYYAKAIDPYAAGQIGWRDSDGDNIFDPLDTDLPVTIDNFTQNQNTITVNGSANVIPYPSPSLTSVTINTLTGIRYRLNGSSWQPATATDGAFDSTSESYQFSTTLSPGLYQLDVAAFDSAGNISNVFASKTVIILDPEEGGLDTQLYPPTPPLVTGETINLDGISYHLNNGIIANVQYRLNDGLWQTAVAQDGVFDSSNEAFHVTIESLEPGTYPLEVFAIDSDGNEESNKVNLTLQIVEAKKTQIFLPSIAR